MKKAYKIIALALILAFCFSFAGCGTGETGTETTSTETAETNDAEVAASADADIGTAETADDNVFILGLNDSFPPMGYRDENNEIVGFDIDVAQAVCDYYGWELVLQPIDWDTREHQLNSGNIDCIWSGMTITAELEESLSISDPYMSNEQVVVVMGDSDYNSLDDLEGAVLALQTGSSADDALDSDENADFKDGLASVTYLGDYLSAFMDMEAGLSGAVLTDSIVANYYIANESKNYRILEGSLAEEQYGVGFRKGDALCDQVNDALHALAASGTLAKISTKWFGKDVTTIAAG